MRTILLALSVAFGLAAPAVAAPTNPDAALANPLIGAWEREPSPDQDWPEGDPRQQITFTDQQMIVGIGDGVALRRYDVGRTTVRAETQSGLVYRFRLAGPDRMCLVPGGSDAFQPVAPAPRCYIRRHMILDRSLV